MATTLLLDKSVVNINDSKLTRKFGYMEVSTIKHITVTDYFANETDSKLFALLANSRHVRREQYYVTTPAETRSNSASTFVRLIEAKIAIFLTPIAF